MFKRANKITSLLVAAAAVVSVVPASAADVTKINSEDGTIYNAVAYADGKAYVDGDVNDSEAAYYVADGDFTALEDVDSGDDAALFGEKYLNVQDGDYTVDLEAGTVTDDNIVDDTFDDAATSLRKKIKDDTDDRYNKTATAAVKLDTAMTVIPGGNYKAPWYETTYAQTKSVNGGGDLTVFTDTEGNYIDADYNLGKIKVKTTDTAAVKADKTVTVENTNDKYDSATTSDAVTVSVSQIGDVLTQDADNVYRLVTVTVKSTTDVIDEINGVTVTTSGTVFQTTDRKTVTYKAIQKISKEAASDDVDGANYAKTVVTYAVSKDDATALSGILAATGSKYTFAGGKLIAYNVGSGESGKVTVNAYTLKSSNGFYYTDEEDKSEEDREFNNTDGTGAAVQTDVDGNLYRLDGGYIYKFDNTDDWNKVYKVDGSFDELSVYDEDNMIAWSESDEVYSVIGGAATTTDETTTDETTTPVVTAGWAQATDGTWTYVKADGTKATGWLQLGGAWYYLKADGVMATGWVNDGGTWYYLAGSGAMATGWLNDNGTWYYLNANGSMAANTTVDGYVLGATGAWVK